MYYVSNWQFYCIALNATCYAQSGISRVMDYESEFEF